MSNNNRPDPFRDLFDDQELASLFDDELADDELDDDEVRTCPGCSGNGRYVGLFEIEDPCQECAGTGIVRRVPSDDHQGLSVPSR